MAVMSSGNIILGDKMLGDKPAIPTGTSVITKQLTERASASAHRTGKPKTDWPKFSGAMSQQQGDTTAQSMPQKFVHLVGYRDPNTKPIRR
jgi:hypothetical protein